MAAKSINLKFNNRRVAGFTGNQLKMIAFLFMLCDHIGYMLIENGVLYGQNPAYWTLALSTAEGRRWYLLASVLRVFGRISFPIFAFCITEGTVHTSNRPRYILRLLIFAVISEVPFDLATRGVMYYPAYQNVLFTLMLGAMSVSLMIKAGKANIILKLLITAVFCAVGYYIRSDYGAVGVLMISMLYLVRNERTAMIVTGAVIAAAESIDYVCVSALAFIFIYFYNGKRGDMPMKYLFYVAYPAHLLLFWAMVYFANR